jgi:hypothetical protein
MCCVWCLVRTSHLGERVNAYSFDPTIIPFFAALSQVSNDTTTYSGGQIIELEIEENDISVLSCSIHLLNNQLGGSDPSNLGNDAIVDSKSPVPVQIDGICLWNVVTMSNSVLVSVQFENMNRNQRVVVSGLGVFHRDVTRIRHNFKSIIARIVDRVGELVNLSFVEVQERQLCRIGGPPKSEVSREHLFFIHPIWDAVEK